MAVGKLSQWIGTIHGGDRTNCEKLDRKLRGKQVHAHRQRRAGHRLHSLIFRDGLVCATGRMKISRVHMLVLKGTHFL